MVLTFARHAQSLLVRGVKRPMSDHEAGQVLARRAAEAKRRAELTLREKQDEMNRRLRDELAAGLVCGRHAR